MMKSLLLLAGLSLFAAGCAERASRYPSLLPRPIESRSDLEPSRPAPALTADPALDRQLADLDRAITEAGTRFDAALPHAEASAQAARGAKPGDERWVAAQTMLGEIDGTHARTLSAVSDLERLAIDRANAGHPAYPALAKVQAHGEAELTREETAIAQLQALVPSAR